MELYFRSLVALFLDAAGDAVFDIGPIFGQIRLTSVCEQLTERLTCLDRFASEREGGRNGWSGSIRRVHRLSILVALARAIKM